MFDAELRRNLLLIREEAPGSLYANMAFDEALSFAGAEAAAAGASGFLRFYSWDSPCVSFGYAQSFQQALADNPGLPLVRRPSGGGAVRHGEDITYSAVLFPDSSLFTLSRKELYLLFHLAIKEAFLALGASCEIRNTEGGNSGYYRCFERAVFGDLLLLDGRKIAGAAQKRRKMSVLTQGSVSIGLVGAKRSKFIAEFIRAFEQSADIALQEYTASEEIDAKVLELEKIKYSSEKWNKERKS